MTTSVGGTSTTNNTGTTNDVLTSDAGNGLNQVDFNTFLKLMVAQLKNQDPLNPVDSTQFTGQIAQFSSLEQQINSNNYLSQLVQQRDFGQQTLATSYLGKVVLAPGNSIATSGGTSEFAYNLSATAAKVDITITDKDGNVVRNVGGDGTTGNHIVTWDGNDDSGKPVPAGTYTIAVKATDSAGTVVTSKTLVYGQVASILNDNGTSSLIMSDGRQINLEDVLAVTSLSTNSGSGSGTGDTADTGDSGTPDA